MSYDVEINTLLGIANQLRAMARTDLDAVAAWQVMKLAIDTDSVARQLNSINDTAKSMNHR